MGTCKSALFEHPIPIEPIFTREAAPGLQWVVGLLLIAAGWFAWAMLSERRVLVPAMWQHVRGEAASADLHAALRSAGPGQGTLLQTGMDCASERGKLSRRIRGGARFSKRTVSRGGECIPLRSHHQRLRSSEEFPMEGDGGDGGRNANRRSELALPWIESAITRLQCTPGERLDRGVGGRRDTGSRTNGADLSTGSAEQTRR